MLTIAADTFQGSRGGIARVCELTARVALEVGYPTSLLSLQSEAGIFKESPCWRGSAGSRINFVLACAKAALRGDHLLYDQLGIARAHILYSRLARPCCVWLHGIEVWKGEQPWEQMEPKHLRAAKTAGLMLANSNFTRQRALISDRHFAAAKVCWLATLEDDPPTESAPLDGPPIVLILGRLDNAAYKGHRELIETWASVVDQIPAARLVIAGGGPYIERYREMAAKTRVENSIDILGFVEDARLPELWKSAVAFAMPSRGEGFGLAYIEAMRWGVPVIASVHDAGAEVSIHGETGLNVDLSRSSDLGDALIKILSDRDLAKRFGAAGQRRWREHFCYSAFRSRFLPLLVSFIES